MLGVETEPGEAEVIEPDDVSGLALDRKQPRLILARQSRRAGRDGQHDDAITDGEWTAVDIDRRRRKSGRKDSSQVDLSRIDGIGARSAPITC